MITATLEAVVQHVKQTNGANIRRAAIAEDARCHKRTKSERHLRETGSD